MFIPILRGFCLVDHPFFSCTLGNNTHLQPLLISNINDLAPKQRLGLEQSLAGTFYQELFCRINEEAFAGLYADVPSRPNIPVNVLVGLETLKSGIGWSDEELYDHFLYDLQVRYAVAKYPGECSGGTRDPQVGHWLER